MINLNVNRIEARLNRPGPNLFTDVYYVVIGGGKGGLRLDGPGGQSGEFKQGSFLMEHGTTATYTVGRGGLGTDSTTLGLSGSTTGSAISYPNNSLTVPSLPSRCVADPGTRTIYPNNVSGSWVHDPSEYNLWAQDGGNGTPAPTKLIGGGGGFKQSDLSLASFPFSSIRGDGVIGTEAGADGYVGTGAGGGAPGFA